MSEGGIDHERAPRAFWLTVMGLGFATLICGSIGVWTYDKEHFHEPVSFLFSLFTSLYAAIEMLILHAPQFEGKSNWWLELGLYFGVAFFSSATIGLVGRRFKQEWRLRFTKWENHVVIFDLSDEGMEWVRYFCQRKSPVIVVDPEPELPFAQECKRLGALLIEQDARQPTALRDARVASASQVYIVSPDDEVNVQIAVEIAKWCEQARSDNLKCHVQLTNIHLRERLQLLGFKFPSCEIQFFDAYDNVARQAFCQLPLGGKGLTEENPRRVHVVILGFGRMGRSLALRAIKMGHFANRQPIHISVIDRNAHRQRERFFFRYPALHHALPSLLQCKLDFHETETESFTARELFNEWSREHNTVLQVFICIDSNTRALEVALRLQDILHGHDDASLHVRMKSRSPLAEFLKISSNSRPEIKIFGIDNPDPDKTPDQILSEDIAIAIHQAYVKKREREDEHLNFAKDPSLHAWDHLPEDLRESNRQQADHAPIKLAAIGYEIVKADDPRQAVPDFDHDEIKLLAEMEHARWNAERLLAGWVHGETSDKAKRINRNIRPWHSLDESAKDYDREAVANLPEILKAVTPSIKIVKIPPAAAHPKP